MFFQEKKNAAKFQIFEFTILPFLGEAFFTGLYTVLTSIKLTIFLKPNMNYFKKQKIPSDKGIVSYSIIKEMAVLKKSLQYLLLVQQCRTPCNLFKSLYPPVQ